MRGVGDHETVAATNVTLDARRRLDNNRLTGGMVGEFSPSLTILTLHHNALTFVELASLPSSLTILTLHNNQLQQAAPSFSNFSGLTTLTLFGNQLRGTLELPHNAPGLSTLLVHGNRLSCEVRYNRSASYNLTNNGDFTSQVALLAPGNRLANSAIPDFAAFSDVAFAWAAGPWADWSEEVVYIIAGMLLLGGGVAISLGRRWHMFFAFKANGPFEEVHLLCTQILLVGGGTLLVVMVPLYVVGAKVLGGL